MKKIKKNSDLFNINLIWMFRSQITYRMENEKFTNTELLLFIPYVSDAVN